MGLAKDIYRARQEGLSVFRSIDLDETEEAVKAGPGLVHSIHATNSNAAARFIKLYDALIADVVVGTTTPKMTLRVPASGQLDVEILHGYTFTTAISAAATTGVADTDTGAPGANEVMVHIGYA